MSAPARSAIGGAVDIVFLCEVRIHHFRVGMESWENRLLVVAIFLEKSLFFSASDRDDGAMTRCELALCLSVLHELESLEVG